MDKHLYSMQPEKTDLKLSESNTIILGTIIRMIELGINLNHVDNLSSQTALFYAAR